METAQGLKVESRLDNIALVPKPILTIRPEGASVVVIWSGPSSVQLQSAPNLTGDWQTLTSIPSPYVVAASSSQTRFFRLIWLP